MAEFYMAFKHTHMLCAVLSLLLFVSRGALAFTGSALLQNKAVKILPHVIDTVLLLSAIALVITTQQYPFASLWVTAKLIGLVAYIVLGVFTLKKARNNTQRAVFFGLSLASFVYIFMVARTKDALFFL